jgi:hypothetical protein
MNEQLDASAKLDKMTLGVFDPEMQGAIKAFGGLKTLPTAEINNLLLVQLLRDSIREVTDGPL